MLHLLTSACLPACLLHLVFWPFLRYIRVVCYILSADCLVKIKIPSPSPFLVSVCCAVDKWPLDTAMPQHPTADCVCPCHLLHLNSHPPTFTFNNLSPLTSSSYSRYGAILLPTLSRQTDRQWSLLYRPGWHISKARVNIIKIKTPIFTIPYRTPQSCRFLFVRSMEHLVFLSLFPLFGFFVVFSSSFVWTGCGCSLAPLFFSRFFVNDVCGVRWVPEKNKTPSPPPVLKERRREEATHGGV